MSHCPGCGGAFSAGAEIHHILGCGYQGPHDHDPKDPDNQNKHHGRHNRAKREYQVSLLGRALKVAGGDPALADNLFNALKAILGEAGTEADP